MPNLMYWIHGYSAGFLSRFKQAQITECIAIDPLKKLKNDKFLSLSLYLKHFIQLRPIFFSIYFVNLFQLCKI